VHKAKFISFSPSKSTLTQVKLGPPIFLLGTKDQPFVGVKQADDGLSKRDLRKNNASKNKKMMLKNNENF